MSNDNAALSEKLDRIEAVVSDLASSTLAIADQQSLLQQEFARSAAQLQRVGLNQESFKLAGQRRDKSLAEIADALRAIRRALENAEK